MPTVETAGHQPSESVALLAQRARVGLWLSLTSITLFALVDPFLHADLLGPLYVFKAFMIAVTIGLFRVLRRPATRTQVVSAVLLAVAVFSVMTAASGVVTDDPATTPVLLMVLSMGTATLLPWGVLPQLAVQAIVVSCVIWNRYAIAGGSRLSSLPLALLVGSFASVYAAHAAERYQRQRQRVEAAERELRARQHQAGLAHAARLSTLGGMAAGLAHEIDQPLTAIVSHASGSARGIRSGEMSAAALLDAVDLIADEALRAGEILRRIREFIRHGDVAPSRADLNALVREALHFAEGEADELGITLRLDLAPGPLEVEVDRMQLEQVILNLVRNGFEAMADNNGRPRELSIETGEGDEGTVQLVVRDTGVGVSHDVSARLFEPFFTTKRDGLGLGLPVSRSIVEAHGGRLWASQDPPLGAAFHVALPAARGRRDAA